MFNLAISFLTDLSFSQQPWSTYAVQLTTLSPPAIIGDAFLWWLLWMGTADWEQEAAQNMFWFLLAWMTFSKFIKLITHFVRYPEDIVLWPVSILFGWFHGGIKVWALLTLSEVSAISIIISLISIANDCDRPLGAAVLELMRMTKIV